MVVVVVVAVGLVVVAGGYCTAGNCGRGDLLG